MGRKPEITEEQVFIALRSRDRDENPVMKTTDVAKRVGTTRVTAGKRLDDLVEEGRVRKSKYGQAAVYWPSDEKMVREPDTDTIELGRAEVEAPTQWVARFERMAASAIMTLVVSSIAFSLSFIYMSVADLGAVPEWLIAITLTGTLVGSVGTVILVPIYWWFDADLTATLKDQLADQGDADSDASGTTTE